MSESNQDNLRETLDEAEWAWLKPHLERDAVILVSRDLDLIQVADAMAEDRSALVEEWIKKGWVGKPSSSQIKDWDKTPSKQFLSVVLQPFVLIQEIIVH